MSRVEAGRSETADVPLYEPTPEPVISHAENTSGDRGESPSVEMDDGCDFTLEYNNARVFLLGSGSSFNFRLTGKGADVRGCEQISITLEFDFCDPITKRIPGLNANGRSERSIAFRPGETNVDLPATVLLTYRKDGKQKRFEGEILWDCYPPNEPSANIIENLVVKLGDISGRGAADMNTNVRVLENFGVQNPESTATQLRGLKLEPVWTVLDLVPAHMPLPPPPPPPDALTERLTLRLGDRRVHLLCAEEVALGKNWRNDIATHVFNAAGSVDEERTARISRFHARIRKRPEGCCLVDGGHNPESGREQGSAHGTYVDGRNVGSLGNGRLRVGDRVTIGLGRRSDHGPPCLEFDVEVLPCDRLRRAVCGMPLAGCRESSPAGVVLKRNDGFKDREVFLVVWKCCSLSLVDPAFGDITVWRLDGAFAVTCGTEGFWLTEGTHFSTNDREIAVTGLEQVGLKRYVERWK